jgi:hypothetical protein
VETGHGATSTVPVVGYEPCFAVADVARAFEASGPKDSDYGKRESSHCHPDGNLLRFGSPLRRT